MEEPDIGSAKTQVGHLSESLEDLIGRHQELERFTEILDGDRPALLLVTGEPQIGKTSLLHEMRERSLAKNWTSVPRLEDWPLSVNPDTNEQTFRSQIQQALGISLDDGYTITTTKRIFPFAEITTDTNTAHTEAVSVRSRGYPLHPIVEQLTSLAPVVLLIDGYRPNQRFARWFTEIFLKDVLMEDARLLVIVADSPDEISALRRLTSEQNVLTLYALDKEVIRERFELLGLRINPALEPDELEVYVDIVHEHPRTINSLVRLLKLAQFPDDTSGAPEGKANG
jgi:hypothetical protein